MSEPPSGSVNAATQPFGGKAARSRESPNFRYAFPAQWRRSGLAFPVQSLQAMLVISRRKGQRVSIGDEIELVVTEVHRSSVKLGIRAPRGLTVLRGEVRDSIEAANREAAASSSDEGVLGGQLPASKAVAPLKVSALRRSPTAKTKEGNTA